MDPGLKHRLVSAPTSPYLRGCTDSLVPPLTTSFLRVLIFRPPSSSTTFRPWAGFSRSRRSVKKGLQADRMQQWAGTASPGGKPKYLSQAYWHTRGLNTDTIPECAVPSVSLMEVQVGEICFFCLPGTFCHYPANSVFILTGLF